MTPKPPPIIRLRVGEFRRNHQLDFRAGALLLEPILLQTRYEASGYNKRRNQDSSLGSSIQSHTPDANMIFKVH
jgi:hypothetical protein